MTESEMPAREDLRLPVALIIMDGFGLAEPGPGNAISLANTPNLDRVFSRCPLISLQASGQAVGLPDGQMGNSEVGHLNIGAGRIVHQELSHINHACEDGSLQHNQVLIDAFTVAKQPGSALHFMGLLSDGGVHSSNEHLYALMNMAQVLDVPRIMIHCFLDGRDVPPSSGKGYIAELQAKIDALNEAAGEKRFVIASVSGRYYAMDRDKRWDRVQKAWEAVAHAANAETALSPQACVQRSYDEGVTDEFVAPCALCDRGVTDGDAVVFFNFRPDRARELTRAFTDEGFEGFQRGAVPRVSFVCLTEYDPEIDAPVAFPKEFPDNVLADVLADAGLRQYHIAETEKYAHVTFFLNGGVEEPKTGERRVLIPSPKVATYDLQPEMSEPDVAQTLADAIANDEADVYIVNFANCDMVGHTGVIPAAVAAVEAVDDGVGKVLSSLREKGGCALVTADHGNADKMLAEDGSPFTAHTTALVPLALVDFTGEQRGFASDSGALCNIAPTLLDLVGLPIPPQMNEPSLLKK